MTQTTHPTLRQRQQLAVQREIVDVALDLFEKQGFRGTTIEDIAQAVGVSARTVFRHFETKNDLVLGWLPAVEALIEEIPLTERTPRSLMAQIEGTIEDMLARQKDVADSENAESFTRFRRLISTDPDLQAALSTWQARVAKLAHNRLRLLLGEAIDELGIQLLIQLVAAPITAAVEAWSHSLDSDLLVLYREAKTRRSDFLSPQAHDTRNPV